MLLALLLFLTASAEAAWFRGNTHTHTLESDGDSSPEDVVRWYREHGYDFLVITDHDKVTRLDGGTMLLIPGEEVTDHLPKKPLHLNAIGIDKPVMPQGGTTVVAVLQHDVDAIREAGGIAAINHPNFGWAFGSEQLLQVKGFTLLEIASGHPYVNMNGPPSVESMWDDLLTAGRRVWGIAVDDSHHLKRPWDRDIAPPGKAWIVVRAATREQAPILKAIREGDFYASTGVELVDYTVTASAMTITIKTSNLAHYRTQFIGPHGKVLRETADNPATFDLSSSSGYVRAKVIDSNGRLAWLQPWFAPEPGHS
jgi:hypothetical protein